MDELKDSPAVMESGAVEVMVLCVGLVKFKSYAIETSPEAVKAVGRLLVTAVSETEKRELPVFLILNKLAALPFAPIFKENKSPVEVVADPGDQSRDNKLPVVRAVEVEDRLRSLPEVREVEDISKAVAVVTEL